MCRVPPAQQRFRTRDRTCSQIDQRLVMQKKFPPLPSLPQLGSGERGVV
ncbi:MAG TPA: hypothetical protein VK138_03740 [Acidiferrobacterales bacterium]|nr:hypothetical protein [Acidiferrobacterales bacterium]